MNLKHILVPVNREPDCAAAVAFSRRLAEIFGDTRVAITLLHVGESSVELPLLPQGPQWTWNLESRQGSTVSEILSAAERHATDLIVMPTGSRDGVLDALRDSVAERVLRHAPCALLAMPAC